jgi:hypothetical protein
MITRSLGSMLPSGRIHCPPEGAFFTLRQGTEHAHPTAV